jgi:hypothetical protein
MTNFSMKFCASLFTAIFALTSFSSPARADNLDAGTNVNVPFGFDSGSRHFEAGKYSIRVQTDELIAIRNGSDVGLAFFMKERNSRPSNRNKIVFRKYGDKYFIREVWVAGSDRHLYFCKSPAEKSAEKMYLASNRVPPENIELASALTSIDKK